MKKLLVLFAAVLGVTFAQAQVSYGLKVGAVLSEFSNTKYEQSTHPSIFFSAYADVPLAKRFSLQPGVSFIGKGSDFKNKNVNTDIDHIFSVMTIEVPVNVAYSIPTGRTGKFMIAAGPYIGINVGGSDNFKGHIDNKKVEVSSDLKYSGEYKNINRIDGGANFNLAYRFTNKLLLSVNYGLGLTDVDPIVSGTQSFRTVSFGVGFHF